MHYLSTVQSSGMLPQFSSAAQSCLTLWPHGLQYARPPCPSPTPGVLKLISIESAMPSNHLVLFSSCPQSLPASGSFQMSQIFASGSQIIWVSGSTSVLPMNIQDSFLLGWAGWIFLQSNELSRVFPNTIVQTHQFLGAQLSL